MIQHVVGLVVPKVLKEHSAMETSGTTNPLIQYHTPNDLNPHLLCCGNLKSRTYR